MTIAICAAVVAGACFALAGVMQQQAASARPAQETMSLRLLVQLAQQPIWLAGIMLAVLAYAFQALALANGPLSLVQPLIVSELVFAIPLAARLHRMRLRRREWLGAGCVAGGLCAALAASHPQAGTQEPDGLAWTWALIAVSLVSLATIPAGRLHGPARASLIALAAGVVMGTQSVLLAVVVDRFHEGGAALVFATWQTYLLIGASAVGLVLIQSAFQAGPIAASMPVIDAAEPAVAIALGVTLFGESVRTGLLPAAVAASGVAVLVVGIVVLDTSPLLAALHQRESEEPVTLHFRSRRPHTCPSGSSGQSEAAPAPGGPQPGRTHRDHRP